MAFPISKFNEFILVVENQTQKIIDEKEEANNCRSEKAFNWEMESLWPDCVGGTQQVSWKQEQGRCDSIGVSI